MFAAPGKFLTFMFLKTNKKNHRKKTHKKHHNKAKSNCYVNSLELLLVLLFYTNGTYRNKADAILFKDILKGWASKITVSRVILFGGKEDLWRSFLQILWLAPWKKPTCSSLPCGSAPQTPLQRAARALPR